MRAFFQWMTICAAAAFVALAIAMLHPSSTVAASSQAKARGAELFATRGCAHCHGTAGVGGREGPDLQLVRKRLKKPQIAHQIHDGGKSMPAYGDDLSSAQIDDLVAYLRAKRKRIVVTPKPLTEAQVPRTVQPDPD